MDMVMTPTDVKDHFTDKTFFFPSWAYNGRDQQRHCLRETAGTDIWVKLSAKTMDRSVDFIKFAGIQWQPASVKRNHDDNTGRPGVGRHQKEEDTERDLTLWPQPS